MGGTPIPQTLKELGRESDCISFGAANGRIASGNKGELALVNIGVAVLAACAHVAEHRLHMALRTRHILVQTPQRITGLVVIEFRDGADRLPALPGVTVLTGNVQIAMWAMGTSGALVRPARKRAQEKQQRHR